MLLRYTASADNTIVSAYQQNLKTRATGSNAGQADVVEVFSVYGRQLAPTATSGGSQELSRFLIKFPIDSIEADRDAGLLPVSGNVSFYLRMFNAETSKTVPIEYSLSVHRVTKDWEEGVGLDLEEYRDLTDGNAGSDWVQARKGTNWTNFGGDYSTTPTQTFEQSFETGLEDMSIDITSMVEEWINNPLIQNYGFLVKLSSSQEAYFSSSAGVSENNNIQNVDGATVSYYTKRFFARGTQYFFKKPTIEARWDSALRDDRANFYFSSSRAPAADNLNTLYFYNFIRGRLANIPSVGTGEILVSLYSGSSDDSAPSGSKLTLYDGNLNLTGGYVSTGIYSCSVGIDAISNIDTLYDVWHDGTSEYFTGSISPKTFPSNTTLVNPKYYISVTNLKEVYSTNEIARINMYARERDWQPTIYTVANNDIETTPIVSASYRVVRILDGYEAVSYGNSTDNHTLMSYDSAGNYFNFRMGLLEPGYAYAFKFSLYDDVSKSWHEQDPVFKFRVNEF